MNTNEQFEQWWSRQKLGGFMNDQITADHVRAAWAQGAAAEREECARVAEKTAVHGNRAIAALIRARNEPTK
jgi:hypothetical protein